MSAVSVSKLVTQNYKNIRLEDGIDFGALTVFIGANGSGKSNANSLFQFLPESLAGSGSDDQRGRTNFEDAVFRLGGARILDGTLDAPANVGIEYQFVIDRKKTTLGIELWFKSPIGKLSSKRSFSTVIRFALSRLLTTVCIIARTAVAVQAFFSCIPVAR
jgi:hypothetical protein